MDQGRPRGKFRSSRGLKQGDPLSPFLFNLVVDGLRRLVERTKSMALIKGFILEKNKVEVSHLQFADDTIFFIYNGADQLRRVVATFKIFL